MKHKEHIYTEAVTLLRNGGLLGSFLDRLKRFVNDNDSTEAKEIADWLPVLDEMNGDSKVNRFRGMTTKELSNLLPVLTHFLGVTKNVTPAMGVERLDNLLIHEFGWLPVRNVGGIKAGKGFIYEVKL